MPVHFREASAVTSVPTTAGNDHDTGSVPTILRGEKIHLQRAIVVHSKIKRLDANGGGRSEAPKTPNGKRAAIPVCRNGEFGINDRRSRRRITRGAHAARQEQSSSQNRDGSGDDVESRAQSAASDDRQRCNDHPMAKLGRDKF